MSAKVKYLIGYIDGDAVKHLCIMFPQMRGFIKCVGSGGKNMSSMIKNDNVLIKPDQIWGKARIYWLDQWIVRKQLDIMPTYYYVQNQGKLMIAKPRKLWKTSIWANFWWFRGQISQNYKFFWKIGFIQIEGHI